MVIINMYKYLFNILVIITIKSNYSHWNIVNISNGIFYLKDNNCYILNLIICNRYTIMIILIVYHSQFYTLVNKILKGLLCKSKVILNIVQMIWWWHHRHWRMHLLIKELQMRVHYFNIDNQRYKNLKCANN